MPPIQATAVSNYKKASKMEASRRFKKDHKKMIMKKTEEKEKIKKLFKNDKKMREELIEKRKRLPAFARLADNPDDLSDDDDEDHGSNNKATQNQTTFEADSDDEDVMEFGGSSHRQQRQPKQQQQQQPSSSGGSFESNLVNVEHSDLIHQQQQQQKKQREQEEQQRKKLPKQKVEKRNRDRAINQLQNTLRKDQSNSSTNKGKIVANNYIKMLTERYGIQDESVITVSDKELSKVRKELGIVHHAPEDKKKQKRRLMNEPVALRVEHVVTDDFTNLSIARVIITGTQHRNGHMQQVTLFDEFVKQDKPVSDYRTDITGIKPQMFEFAVTLEQVIKSIEPLVDGRPIICYDLSMTDMKRLGLFGRVALVRDLSYFNPLTSDVHLTTPEAFNDYLTQFLGFLPAQKDLDHMNSADKTNALLSIHASFPEKYNVFYVDNNSKNLLEKRQEYTKKMAQRIKQQQHKAQRRDGDAQEMEVDPQKAEEKQRRDIVKLKAARHKLDTTLDSLVEQLKRS